RAVGDRGHVHFPHHFAKAGRRPVAATDHVGHDARPAGLMGCAKTRAVVPVEILVKEQVVLPGRVVLPALDAAETGPSPVWPGQEDRDEAVPQVVADGPEGHLLAGGSWILQRELAAKEPL